MDRRLFRSRHNRVLAGVCGGIGEYFNVDPVIVRLLWVLVTFLGGAGVLMYIVAIIIIPLNQGAGYSADTGYREDGGYGQEQGQAGSPEYKTGNQGLRTLLIIVLAAVGIVAALHIIMVISGFGLFMHNTDHFIDF